MTACLEYTVLTMRVFFFALYVWAGVLANDMRAQWNVLYGHEEFRHAETMLQEYLGKLRASSEAQREKLIGGLRDRGDTEKFQAQTAARCTQYWANSRRGRL